MDTDSLIAKVLTVGAPLPKYSYDYRAFTAEFVSNDMVGGVHVGMIMDSFPTFQEACLWIIEQDKEFLRKQRKRFGQDDEPGECV